MSPISCRVTTDTWRLPTTLHLLEINYSWCRKQFLINTLNSTVILYKQFFKSSVCLRINENSSWDGKSRDMSFGLETVSRRIFLHLMLGFGLEPWCLGLGLEPWCLGLGLGFGVWCLGLGLEVWCLGYGLGLVLVLRKLSWSWCRSWSNFLFCFIFAISEYSTRSSSSHSVFHVARMVFYLLTSVQRRLVLNSRVMHVGCLCCSMCLMLTNALQWTLNFDCKNELGLGFETRCLGLGTSILVTSLIFSQNFDVCPYMQGRATIRVGIATHAGINLRP